MFSAISAMLSSCVIGSWQRMVIRCGPHAGRRSEPLDGGGIPILENYACSQEGDAADHLGGNTGRVSTPQTVYRSDIHKGVF